MSAYVDVTCVACDAMNKHKALLIAHAKREPLASQYASVQAYNEAYIAWHDRYIVLIIINDRQVNEG